MNKFRNGLILYCCIQFLSLATAVVYGYGEYGFAWSDTLNFHYPDLNLLTNKNVLLYVDLKDEKLLDIKSLKGKTFDVDRLHMALGKLVSDDKLVRNVGKGRNLVVGGITLLLKRDDGYEAFFKVLRGKEAKPLVFVSGSTEKQEAKSDYECISASEQYDPGSLFIDFYDRMKLVYEQGRTEPSGVIKETNSACDEYKVNTYGRAAAGLATSFSRELAASGTKSPFEIRRIFRKQLERAMVDYGNECNAPFIDSEQYLLGYLKKTPEELKGIYKLIDDCTILPVGYANAILGGIKGEIGELNASSKTEIDTTSDKLENMLHKIRKLKSVYSREAIVGYILHLHSTNEICHCCALSLSQELVRGNEENSLAKQINDVLLGGAGETDSDTAGGAAAAAAGGYRHGRAKPFFLVLTSSSNQPYSGATTDAALASADSSAGGGGAAAVTTAAGASDAGGGMRDAEAASSQPHIKRMGIGKENVLPKKDSINGLVDISSVLAEKLILQMYVVPTSKHGPM